MSVPRCPTFDPGEVPCTPLVAITAPVPYSVPVVGNGEIIVSENGSLIIGVLRGNGTPLSVLNAGNAGENIALFAYGLGAVAPAVVAGQPPPNPPALASGSFRLTQDVRYDAPPYRDPARSLPEIQPDFIGLVPGLAGLYQINLKAPAVPRDNQGCPIMGGIIFTIVYQSNVTLTLSGRSSYDGIGICVRP